MLRSSIIKTNHSSNDQIKWRNHEVFRIEAFSDAVFAFSITLLIVSLEVPENFEQLIRVMKGFFAFAICFFLLFQIWYAQFKFFRRYGMQDNYTLMLNAFLLFVVLFYMYPLKFLFNLLIPGGTEYNDSQNIISDDQYPLLMMIYGLGFVLVQSIFVLMFYHALKKKNELQLDEKEIFVTRSKIYGYFLTIMIGVGSIAQAYFSEPVNSGNSGWYYLAMVPVLFFYKHYRKKKFKKTFSLN